MNHPTQNALEKIRQEILKWLSYRDYPKAELIQKLTTKSYSNKDIMVLIDDFVELGIINDVRFTEHYVERRKRKGYGPLRILQELQMRGIDDGVIAEHLKITDNTWLIEIRTLWLKQFKGKVPSHFKDRAKQMRFLYHRGFNQEQINSIYKDTYDTEE